MEESYYLDGVFLVNFLMDYLLLWLTGTALKRRSSVKRCAAGACMGAALSCIGLIFARTVWLRGILLASGAAGICRVVYRSRGWQLLQDVIVFFGVTFVLGGMLESLEAEGGIVLLVLTAISAVLLHVILRVRKEQEKRKIYTVELVLFGERLRCRALLDTGNNLYEPIRKWPVIICEKQLLYEYISRGMKEHPESFCMIPYYSVGKKEGLLIGAELSELVIFQSAGEIHQNKIIAAISDVIEENHEYQVILHPDLL